MEQQLQLIEYQLWSVIALFLLLIGMNVVCFFVNRPRRKGEPQFADMWKRDDLNNLVSTAGDYLRRYPNDSNALYFRAKALVAKRQNLAEAEEHLKRLKKIEPTLREAAQKVIDEIQNMRKDQQSAPADRPTAAQSDGG